jgi:uncharacterized iron-regulated membrane protein
MVERPQQVWLRRAAFQVHLWAGLIVALYIIAIGISGSLLVFKEELMPRPHANVGAVDLTACTPARAIKVISLVNQAYPQQTAFLLSCPTEANPLFVTTIRAKGQARTRQAGVRPKQLAVYSNPQTGEIMGSADREASWVNWVEELHVNLLLGRGGRLWNGIGASVLLALIITGLLLWWPGIRLWKRGLTLNFSRSWKRINWDLHNVTGFWTVFFVLMWALTGMYFTWPRLFTEPIRKVSAIRTAEYPAAQMRSIANRPKSPPQEPDLQAILAESQSLSAQAHFTGFFYGAGPKPIFTVYMSKKRVGDYANTDFLYFDQNTSRHLYTWHRGDNQTLGDWLVWLVAPLHFGTSWGLGIKIAWALLGLVLPLLTVTGMFMYWNRWLSKAIRGKQLRSA